MHVDHTYSSTTACVGGVVNFESLALLLIATVNGLESLKRVVQPAVIRCAKCVP